MKAYSVLLVWDPQATVWHASVPALPGLHTSAESRADALERARRAIGLRLRDFAGAGARLPEESFIALETVRVEA